MKRIAISCAAVAVVVAALGVCLPAVLVRMVSDPQTDIKTAPTSHE